LQNRYHHHYHPLPVARCPSPVARRPSPIVRRPSPFARRPSPTNTNTNGGGAAETATAATIAQHHAVTHRPSPVTHQYQRRRHGRVKTPPTTMPTTPSPVAHSSNRTSGGSDGSSTTTSSGRLARSFFFFSHCYENIAKIACRHERPPPSSPARNCNKTSGGSDSSSDSIDDGLGGIAPPELVIFSLKTLLTPSPAARRLPPAACALPCLRPPASRCPLPVATARCPSPAWGVSDQNLREYWLPVRLPESRVLYFTL